MLSLEYILHRSLLYTDLGPWSPSCSSNFPFGPVFSHGLLVLSENLLAGNLS